MTILKLLILFGQIAAAAPNCWQRDGHYVLAAADVPYQKTPDTQKLDVYHPSNSSPPFKTVMSIHGGCFQWGSKSADEDMENIQRFTSAGYAVVSVDYRLVDLRERDPLKRNLFPAALEDVQDALRWIRGNGANYKLKTDEVLVFGYSAGATLAAYLGTRPVLGSSRRLDARPQSDPGFSRRAEGVIDFFGRTDFERSRASEVHRDGGKDCGEEFVGTAREASTQPAFEKASVLPSVNANSTAFLIVHGTADEDVSSDHSEMLFSKLQRTSRLSENERARKLQFLKIEGGAHMLTKREDSDRAWSAVCAYLKEILGSPLPAKTAENQLAK